MWCHVCIIDFPVIEDFKYHIERCHSRMTSSESEESDNEIANVSERESDDFKAASNKFEGESYDSDHNMPAEKKSDDSDAYINTSPGLFHYDSDRSITTKNISDKIAAAHTSQDKCYDSDFEENNSCEKIVALNQSPSDSPSDNDSKARVSNSLLGKRKISNKKNIKARGLKKSVRKRRKKLSASSHQKDIPEQSDNNETDHSESSFNQENNPQPVLNYISPNSSINSNPTSINNPLFHFHPFAGPNANNSVIIHSVTYEVRRTETYQVINF